MQPAFILYPLPFTLHPSPFNLYPFIAFRLYNACA